MTTLPITHLTLYKHGVGFFQRSGKIKAEQIKLLFRADEMNDILKSLTVLDAGKGKVLGVDYATPQSRDELLEGCSIILDEERSLRDLLSSLRGRKVVIWLKANEGVRGLLLGMDELPDRQPIAGALVSVLLEESAVVRSLQLAEISGVELLDEQSARDLKFFLQTAQTQEEFRQVTLRLTPGDHDLSVSYIAPAPTWRVSYRLVSSPVPAKETPKTLLQGWGIFDNRLEEDLDQISLSLVAGMPISFIYDLYTPFTPERPTIEEENRTSAGPVEFESAMYASEGAYDSAPKRAMPPPAPMMAAPAARAAMNMEDLEDSIQTNVSAQELGGELFEYRISTPVSVGRGQSAMAPVVSCLLEKRKELIYNDAQMERHPVATLRLKNTSGLVLERGPVTVIEDGEYVGEAVLPFTPAGGEILVPYAVELGVTITEESGHRSETHSLKLSGALLHIETWEIIWREYRILSRSGRDLDILIEHPRNIHYERFDTPEPAETTARHLRFNVSVPARSERALRVQERRLTSRREELKRQSYEDLQRLARKGLIKPEVMEKAAAILRLWEQVNNLNAQLANFASEREALYRQQKQIQGNMSSLTGEGREAALRARYVGELEASENRLAALASEEGAIRRQIKDIEAEITRQVKALD